MVRIVLGLALAAIPPALELREGIPDDWGGAFRPLVWILFVGLGLLAIVSGVRAFRAEIALDRAYGAAGGRFRLSRPALSILFPFILAMLVSLSLLAQIEAEDARTDWPPKEELVHLPPKDALRFLSLGYREFLADLLWLRAINYFGEHLHTDRKYVAMDRYIEAVIALDPLFQAVYKYAGTVSMYNLKRITKQSVESSIHYLEQGYRRFPQNWEFPFMICANYLFEMPRYAKDAAEKRRYQETGAEYCREASVLPGALQYLPTMTGGVLSQLGERQLAARHFRELILRTEDPKLRRDLEQRYAALASEGTAKRVEQEAAEFFKAHEQGFPYLSPDLFLLVGRRGALPDGAAEIRHALATADR
jgi:hypothetical protein